MRLLTSQLNGPGPIVVARGTAEADAQRRAQAPILWPRWDASTNRMRMVPTPVERLPPGWQSSQVHVPMRLASCEETDCPMFLHGWTEVIPFKNAPIPQAGIVTQDQAVETWGTNNGNPPAVIQHPAGTPCPRIHKVPSGVPPLYTINGRTVLWNEFEDSVGNGVEATQRLHDRS